MSSHSDKKSNLPWHAMEVDAVLDALEVDKNGLTSSEAEKRLEKYGRNKLKEAERQHPLIRFLGHFHNVLIYVLLAAAVLTGVLGHWLDMAVILVVVVLNGTIGFIQEGKAEAALDAIRKMLSLEAGALRDGERGDISSEYLVPGDIVYLDAGDKVPADIRLIDVKDLQVDEATLTGESEPAMKDAQPLEEDADLGDRGCMVYSGTMLTRGSAMGVVVATGSDTEIGKINTMVSEVQTLTTPLLRQVDQFGRRLTIVILLAASLVLIYGTLATELAWGEVFLAVVGLAVAAIPEGLPAILTITLAIGVQQMAKRNAIIRKLPAVETLGSVTVICSDKTGTLTRNEMTVTHVVTREGDVYAEGTGYAPEGKLIGEDGEEITPDESTLLKSLLKGVVLCNDSRLIQREGAWVVEGDPMEGALLALAQKGDWGYEVIANNERLDIVPFSSDHKYMMTLHRGEDENLLYVKGAPEQLLDMCNTECSPDGRHDLDREFWESVVGKLASEGLRTLAVAKMLVPEDQHTIEEDQLEGKLDFLGLIGLMDPPRDEAKDAVAACHAAGIIVKMITGDHAMTAKTIAAQLGIGIEKKVMSGRDLNNMDAVALKEAAMHSDVFARVTPEHKLKLVEALQSNGHIVAMTGDGVNDAPALKKADIGIAMGIKGTEAAKEASKMVLTDDNFASIARAIEEGRTVYDNLKKSLLFILPTNGGQSLIIIASILFGLTLPITPVQILWVNMITAVTLALALAFEPTEEGVMKRPPRDPAASLLPPFFLWRIMFVSILLMVGSLGLFLWHYGGNADVLDVSRTLAVNTLIMGQVFYLFNCRIMKKAAWHPGALFSNPYALGAALLILFAQAVFTYLPIANELFNTSPLPFYYWAYMLMFGILVFILVEVEKWLMRVLGIGAE